MRGMTPEKAIRDLFSAPIYAGRVDDQVLDAVVSSPPLAVSGDVEFRAIPGALAPNGDDFPGCVCPWCSPDGLTATSRGFNWDAVAFSAGSAWMVHYPELHHQPMRRGWDRVERSAIELTRGA